MGELAPSGADLCCGALAARTASRGLSCPPRRTRTLRLPPSCRTVCHSRATSVTNSRRRPSPRRPWLREVRSWPAWLLRTRPSLVRCSRWFSRAVCSRVAEEPPEEVEPPKLPEIMRLAVLVNMLDAENAIAPAGALCMLSTGAVKENTAYAGAPPRPTRARRRPRVQPWRPAARPRPVALSPADPRCCGAAQACPPHRRAA